MRISRPLAINIALGTVVVAALVAGVIVLHQFGTTAAVTDADTVQLTATVQKGVVSSTISAGGSLAPGSEVTSSFDVSGTLTSVAVAVGSTVTAGQNLGTIDATQLQKAQTTAATQLANAKQQVTDARAAATAASTVTSAATSTDSGSTGATSGAPGGSGGGAAQSGGQSGAPSSSGTSPAQAAASKASAVASASSQLSTAQAQVVAAQSAYDAATAALSSATLTAPIAGVVVAVNGSVGSVTQAGSRAEAVTPSGTTSSTTSSQGGAAGAAASGFVTIADASTLTMTANIAEANIAKVSVGQDATVHFPALGAETASAKVTSIAPTATTSNSVVTYATTIALTSAPTGLRLGQTAQVSITTQTTKTAALYVPTAAITTADGVSTVTVVGSDGSSTEKTVTTGVAGDVGTVVMTGLRQGEKVVIGSVSASQSSTGSTPGRTRFGSPGGFGGAGGTGSFSGRPPGGTGGFGGAPPGGNN